MELLSVTMNDGVMPRSEIEGKDNSSEDKSNYKVVCKGDMVYNSMRMWQGANGISDYDGIVSPAYTVLMPTEEIDNCYFAALFKTPNLINEFRKNSQGLTSDTWNLKYPQISPIRLYIPSLHEQHKISGFISALESRIRKQCQLVDSLKKYKRGAVSRLLNGTLTFNDCSDTESWQLRRVGDFCEVQMCKRVFKEQTTPDGDVPFYKIGTIGGLPDAYISRFLYEDYKRKYSFPRKGEFLISCAGTVGKCVLYNGEDAYYQDSNLVWLRNNSPDVFNDYLFVLVSNVDWTTLNSTTITRIYNDNLRDLRFYIPPMQIQKRIVDYIFTLSSRIDIEQMTLDKLQQERMGLLQQLFI